MSELTEKIRSKGHWEVTIRPEPFEEDRLGYGELDEILIRSAVRMRGWPVPFIDHRKPLLRGEAWVGQDIDAEMVSHHEAWRYFTSGQFTQLRAISADWREGQEAARVPQGYDAVIEVWEILFYLTEVFELAARLALKEADAEQVTIAARLNGMQNRGLIVADDRRASFFEPYRYGRECLESSVTLGQDQLVAESQGQAIEMSRHFFLRSGWKPTVDLLAEYQRELTERT
jgi:hypothetical protein